MNVAFLITVIVVSLFSEGGTLNEIRKMLQTSGWIIIWFAPWFACIYLFRMGMAFISCRLAAIGLYIFGIILMAAIVYPLAFWLGSGDGEGQAFLGLTAAMAMAILISAGIADIVLRRIQPDAPTSG